MKQFNKYGVAVAVAAVAAAANAQPTVSTNEVGDLAIVPYYTVEGGKNTGVHIINTSASTQVVKFRMRRGADSKDALDFNVVLSPQDEWTASIQAGGATGVQVVTADTSCTVPAFTNGVAQMPSTYSAGATEGYIEVIGMGQTINEDQPIAVAAKHKAGVPADCAEVRENFYRVSDAAALAGAAEVRGVHYSNYTSSGQCSVTAALAATSAGVACFAGVTASNVSAFENAANALKVSYFVRDADGGLEFGDNAVMVEDFSNEAMMTNQQPLVFTAEGVLTHDPLNFELPNLGFGAYEFTGRGTNGTNASFNGNLFDDLRLALGTDAVANDWSDKTFADATVNTDWVVTLPGQYLMQDNFCAAYDNYSQAATACASTTAVTLVVDRDELPLTVTTTSTTEQDTSNISVWDREEGVLQGEDIIETPDQDLGFSPGGSAIDPTVEGGALLQREVNVIVWSQDAESMGVLDSAESQSETLGLRTVLSVPGDADNGWARLAIRPVNESPQIFVPSAAATGNEVEPAIGGTRTYGAFRAVSTAGDTPVVGFTAWQRNFGANASANYGRAIEHSKVSVPSST